ncbi:MAG: SDR family oxidoreductase [bacterium]|jgi:uncharacterized protein YbjT (DUF2867 family)|nr:SDR family oxidoreductase [bacterium]
MVLITGATGTVGSNVLRILVNRGEPVRAMTRDPQRIPASLPASLPGIEVARADFDDPPSLLQAVRGVDAIFLMSAPASPSARHELAMLEAARAGGVSRIVKLSAIGTGETIDGKTLGRWHLRSEQALRADGFDWTVLRPSVFASNSLWWADAIASGRPISNLTGAGVQGVVDPRDVAGVAVEALLSPTHGGRTYTLTGPDLLSVPDQAAVLTEVLGVPVRSGDTPLDDARTHLLASGMDAAAVDVMVTGLAWTRAGHNAVVTDDVERVLGRPPASFERWCRDHRAAFGAG